MVKVEIDDLNSQYGLDCGKEIMKILSDELAKEMDKEILKRLGIDRDGILEKYKNQLTKEEYKYFSNCPIGFDFEGQIKNTIRLRKMNNIWK